MSRESLEVSMVLQVVRKGLLKGLLLLDDQGFHNLDFLAKMCFCLKSSSLSENRHGKEDGFRLRVSGRKFSSLPSSGKIVMKHLLRV
jgi:hypothetical protein